MVKLTEDEPFHKPCSLHKYWLVLKFDASRHERNEVRFMSESFH